MVPQGYFSSSLPLSLYYDTIFKEVCQESDSSKTPVFRYHLSKISHRQRVILNGIHQIHVTDLFTTQIIG